MHKSIFTLLFLCSALYSVAQSEMEPVHLSTKKVQDSLQTKVQITFEIDSNWIVYDSITGSDGPIPLSILIKQKGRLVKPNLKKKFDELFGMDIFYIENSAIYEYILSPGTTMKELTIEIEYMSCNLVSGICLPPMNQLFTIPLK